MVNSRNGQEMEEGEFFVRELTDDERKRLPSQVARHEGETAFGSQRICITRHNSFYVLVWD